MHCPSCNRTLAAGVKCPKCGKMSVASSVDEIDLMPMDEPKTTGDAAFQPPPEAFLPRPTMPGKGPRKAALASAEGPPLEEPRRSRAGAMIPKTNQRNLIIGGVVLLLVVLFIGWRVLRTENKVIGINPIADNKMFTIQPNQALVKNVQISGRILWTFEVSATDDTVGVGVVPRHSSDPQTIVALKKLQDPYDQVKKGETHPLSGEFSTGSYSWVVLNETKKAVRVKVKFNAQP